MRPPARRRAPAPLCGGRSMRRRTGLGRDGAALAADVRTAAGAFRRARRRPDATDGPRAPPPDPPGPVRACSALPASVHGPAVADRQGPGAVRRRRRPRLLSVRRADVVGDRRDHHRRRPPPRLARRRGRLAVDHRRHGRDARGARRQDPHRRHVVHHRDIPAADVVLLDLAPAASPRSTATGCRDGSPEPDAGTATGPGTFKVDLAIEDGVPWTNGRRGGRGPSTWGGPSRRSPPPNATSPRGACPSGRSSSSASNIWPTRPARRQHPSAVTLRPRPPRLHRRRHRRDPRPDRTVRARVPRPHRRPSRAPHRQMPAYNPNYVGGDIITGANTRQLVLRPAHRPRPLQRPASRAPTSARRPALPAPAPTGCADSTPRARPCEPSLLSVGGPSWRVPLRSGLRSPRRGRWLSDDPRVRRGYLGRVRPRPRRSLRAGPRGRAAPTRRPPQPSRARRARMRRGTACGHWGRSMPWSRLNYLP